MIEYKKGDILREDVDALVNTVNCVGIMGRGIALQFKNAFPENFRSYVAACERNEAQPGQMLIFKTGRLTNPKYIINFPTKRHWRGKSRIEDIDAGLVSLVNEIRSLNIHSMPFPLWVAAWVGSIGPTCVRVLKTVYAAWKMSGL